MKTKQLLDMNKNVKNGMHVTIEISGKQKMNWFESEEQINEIGLTKCREEFW
ncbi:hypothetical protein SAMN05428987_1783 [Paenibacillus sp. CF095]|uniref:hypothetical protein n=1 Tax=Paenibacillus TaxID=44249 RepID=UPI000885B8E5|nr:hypothetical protein [Paenibacillus sp. CF095]SDC55859.1 hypothetical protein SAMN05428987_1783 [Paenibacillus sp. CF095]